MSRLATLIFGLLALATCHSTLASAADAPPFTWPADLVYDGEQRSPAWAEAAYRKVAARIVLADGRYYHLDEPTRAARPAGSAWADHVLAILVTPLDDGMARCECDGATYTARLAPAAELPPKAELILTPNPNPAPGAPNWYAVAVEPRPITRAQFVAAIRAGLQLHFTRLCPDCEGKGAIVTPAHESFDRGSRRIVPAAKRPCDTCKGTGSIPVRRIKR